MLPRHATLAIGAAMLVCCGAAPAADETTSVTEQIVEVMKTIKDAGTAKAAVPKLDALADKMLQLRKRLKTAFKEQPKSRKGAQAGDAKRAAEVMTAYGKELERVNSIPGAAQPLQGFLKKMQPDAETTEALGSAVERALAERAKKAAAKNPHLTPDPNFNGNVADVFVRADWEKWFPSAKKGDFVQLVSGTGDRSRHEVIEIERDSAIIATISEIFGSRMETRFRMKFGPDAQRPPGPALPQSQPVETETITVGDRDLACQVKKDGILTRWYCQDVPFDGLVKQKSPHGQTQLVEFDRGSGPSPEVPQALAAGNRSAATATSPIATSPDPTPPGIPVVKPRSEAARPSNAAATPEEKIQDLQSKIEACDQQIAGLDADLEKAQSTAKDLEKKLKRMAAARSKSKRANDAKSEFQRQLNQTRTEIGKLKGEIKKNQNQIARYQKELESLQPQAVGNAAP